MKHSKQSDLLLPEDISFLPVLVKYLKTLKGEARAKNAKDIIAKYPKVFGKSGSRGKLNAMIYEIRIQGLISNLIASPLGYFCTVNPTRVVEYTETLQRHIKARKESLQSFGEKPGKGLKMRYKVSGYYRKNGHGKYVRSHWKTARGYKGANQMSINFEVEAEKPTKKKKSYNQLNLF